MDLVNLTGEAGLNPRIECQERKVYKWSCFSPPCVAALPSWPSSTSLHQPTASKTLSDKEKKTAAPIDHTFIASRQWFRDFQITGFVWGQCWSFFHRRVLHSFGSSVIALSIKADDPLLIIQKFYRTRKKYVSTLIFISCNAVLSSSFMSELCFSILSFTTLTLCN